VITTALSHRHTTIARLAGAAVLAALALSATERTALAAPSAPLPSFSGHGDGTSGDGSTSDYPWGDSDSPGGPPNAGSNAESMLLSARQASEVTGGGSLSELSSRARMLDSSATVSPASCVSTYSPAQTTAYNTVSPQAVSQRVLSDAQRSHMITEAVVTMYSADDAMAQLKSTAKNWKQCAGIVITSDSADGSGPASHWTNDQPRVSDDHTVLSLAQSGNSFCERAMAVVNNAVIDVMSCGQKPVKGQAVAVVNAIAERGSSSTT
jgi:hypothetical protein